MMFKLVLLLTVTSVWSEKSGPYVPSGWKPTGARLELPQEYGAPFTASINYQIPSQQINFNAQINAEDKSIATTTEYIPTTTDYDYETTTFDRGYLPPLSAAEIGKNNQLNVQGLPNPTSDNTFNEQPEPTPTVQESAKFSEWGDFKSQFFASQYQLHLEPRSGQLRIAPKGVNGQRKSGRLETSTLATEYGAPQDDNQNEEDSSEVEIVNQTPEEKANLESNEETEASGDQSNEDNSQESENSQEQVPQQQSQIMGQYYILAPDNTLQRVMYGIIKTEDDIKNKGFTAELKYSPVEPIKDPVYGYNAMGQLIKLYKKK